MEDKKILSVENKEGKVVNMKENIFNDTNFSRFTSHFSRDLYKKNRTYKVLFFQLIYEEYLNEL